MELRLVKFIVLLTLLTPFCTAARDWWKNAVIYQIIPFSFKDSDGNGYGDLRGITGKLSYLKDIHVDAICLSSIYDSPGKNLGYDVSDYKTINKILGTMEDFEELIAEAKKLGIKVILDFVPNHTSDKHSWFIKSVNREDPYTDYYVWHNGIQNTYGSQGVPNDWLSVLGDSAWTWNSDRGQYYLHHFTSSEPELNYNNPLVLKEIQQLFDFWLEKGVLGFKINAVSYLADNEDISSEQVLNLPLTYNIVREWRKHLDIYRKDSDNVTRLLIVEPQPTSDFSEILKYYGNDDAPGAHISLNLELVKNLNKGFTATELAEIIKTYVKNSHNTGTYNWMVGTADTHRVATRFGVELVDAINMLIMSLPGVSISYYGEEIGMEDTYVPWGRTLDPLARMSGSKYYFKESRDHMRTPFQWDATSNAGFSTNLWTWLPVNYNHEEINLLSEMLSDKSHYKVYKMMSEAHHTPTFEEGTLHIDVQDNLLILTRHLEGSDTYVTVINFAEYVCETLNLEKYQVNDATITVYAASSISKLNESTVINEDALTLEPNEALLLKIQYGEKMQSRLVLEDTLLQAENSRNQLRERSTEDGHDKDEAFINTEDKQRVENRDDGNANDKETFKELKKRNKREVQDNDNDEDDDNDNENSNDNLSLGRKGRKGRKNDRDESDDDDNNRETRKERKNRKKDTNESDGDGDNDSDDDDDDNSQGRRKGGKGRNKDKTESDDDEKDSNDGAADDDDDDDDDDDSDNDDSRGTKKRPKGQKKDRNESYDDDDDSDEDDDDSDDGDKSREKRKGHKERKKDRNESDDDDNSDDDDDDSDDDDDNRGRRKGHTGRKKDRNESDDDDDDSNDDDDDNSRGRRKGRKGRKKDRNESDDDSNDDDDDDSDNDDDNNPERRKGHTGRKKDRNESDDDDDDSDDDDNSRGRRKERKGRKKDRDESDNDDNDSDDDDEDSDDDDNNNNRGRRKGHTGRKKDRNESDDDDDDSDDDDNSRGRRKGRKGRKKDRDESDDDSDDDDDDSDDDDDNNPGRRKGHTGRKKDRNESDDDDDDSDDDDNSRGRRKGRKGRKKDRDESDDDDNDSDDDDEDSEDDNSRERRKGRKGRKKDKNESDDDDDDSGDDDDDDSDDDDDNSRGRRKGRKNDRNKSDNDDDDDDDDDDSDDDNSRGRRKGRKKDRSESDDDDDNDSDDDDDRDSDDDDSDDDNSRRRKGRKGRKKDRNESDDDDDDSDDDKDSNDDDDSDDDDNSNDDDDSDDDDDSNESDDDDDVDPSGIFKIKNLFGNLIIKPMFSKIKKNLLHTEAL